MLMPAHRSSRGIGAALRRLSPATASGLAGVLAFLLLAYVFGVGPSLRALPWVGVGAAVGWVGSLVMRTDTQDGILFDMLIGATGALCGLLLFGTIGQGGSLEKFLSSIVGSAILLALSGLARHVMHR